MRVMLRNPDHVFRTALLGVRFWDEVTSTPIDSGLKVELRSKSNPGLRTCALANKHGVYVVHDAPGLTRSARESGDAAFWANPPESGEYVVEVTDMWERFQPVEMEARLPVKGFFVPDSLLASPPVASPPRAGTYVPLFSTAVRAVPGGMAVVRAELRSWPREEPLSWALLAVEYQGTVLARGVADREGKTAVIFPYPEPQVRRRASPPEDSILPHWRLEISVFHSPGLSGLERPELSELLSQPRARLLDGLSPVADLGPVTLTLGRELIVRSAASPFVFVEAA
jgi:hypothetical protein